MPWPSASLTASVMRSCFLAFSRTATVSPALTEYDAMLTTSPLTVMRAVRDQLARFGAGRAEAHAVDDVVEARLEQHQQVRAGVALAALGFGEVAAELALEDAVHALDLLLLAQLDAVVGRAACPRCGRAGRAWSRTSPCRRSAGARSSGRGRSLRDGKVWPWGRDNVPRDVLVDHLTRQVLGRAPRESGECCCRRSDGGLTKPRPRRTGRRHPTGG